MAAIASALPFSREQFLGVFETYNRAVWPAQVILYAVGIACVALVFVDRPAARRTTLALLAMLWLWMAFVYHLEFFTRINVAAWGFGGLFIVEAVLLVAAAFGERPRHSEPPASRGFAAVLVLYAIIVYPLLGAVSDHAYPRAPTFGLPCPTTIFTFGILLLLSQSVPWWLFVIPALWAVVGATAPFQFGIWEDLGLLVAAFIAITVRVARRRHAPPVRLTA